MQADAVKEAMRIFKKSDEVTIIPFYEENDENKHLCIQVEDDKCKLFSRAVDYPFSDWRRKSSIFHVLTISSLEKSRKFLKRYGDLKSSRRCQIKPYIIVQIEPSTLVLKTGGSAVEAQHTIHHYGSDINTRIGLSVESLKDAVSHTEGGLGHDSVPRTVFKECLCHRMRKNLRRRFGWI